MKSTAAPEMDAAAARKRVKSVREVRFCVLRGLLREYRHYLEQNTLRRHRQGIDIALWNEDTQPHLTHFRLKSETGVIEYLYDASTDKVSRLMADGDIRKIIDAEIPALIAVLTDLVEERVFH